MFPSAEALPPLAQPQCSQAGWISQPAPCTTKASVRAGLVGHAIENHPGGGWSSEHAPPRPEAGTLSSSGGPASLGVGSVQSTFSSL